MFVGILVNLGLIYAFWHWERQCVERHASLVALIYVPISMRPAAICVTERQPTRYMTDVEYYTQEWTSGAISKFAQKPEGISQTQCKQTKFLNP